MDDVLGITDKQISPTAGIHPTKILGGAGHGSVFGKTWFVNSSHTHSGDGTNKGRRQNSPFSSLRYLIDNSGADSGFIEPGRGDVVLLGPGHQETLGSVKLSLDINTVTIIGHGHGSKRPVLFFDDVASQVEFTESNQKLHNVRFVTNAALTGPMLLLTGADQIEIYDCLFKEGSGVPTLDIIEIAAAADRFVFMRNRMDFPSAGPDALLSFTGDSEGHVITDNILSGDCSDAPIWGDTFAITETYILRNCIRSLQAKPPIDFNGAVTGVVAFNFGEHTAGQLIDFSGGAILENYFDAVGNDLSGILSPPIV